MRGELNLPELKARCLGSGGEAQRSPLHARVAGSCPLRLQDRRPAARRDRRERLSQSPGTPSWTRRSSRTSSPIRRPGWRRPSPGRSPPLSWRSPGSRTRWRVRFAIALVGERSPGERAELRDRLFWEAGAAVGRAKSLGRGPEAARLELTGHAPCPAPGVGARAYRAGERRQRASPRSAWQGSRSSSIASGTDVRCVRRSDQITRAKREQSSEARFPGSARGGALRKERSDPERKRRRDAKRPGGA